MSFCPFFCFLLICLFGAADTARAGLFDFMNRERVHTAYRSLVDWIPAEQIRLDVAVWYPTRTEPGKISTGGMEFNAARNGRPIPGTYPLILLSHDSSGTRFSYHHLAARLVELGYIVAAPQHEGDNADDMSLLFSDTQLTQRSRQLRCALDLILNDPDIGPLVDPSRIALVGFGNGGTAGLLNAGASLSPDEWKHYCPELAGRGKADPYCVPFIADRMSAMTELMRTHAQDRKAAADRRLSALRSRDETLSRFNSLMKKRHKRLSAQYSKRMQDIPVPPAFLPPLPPLPPQERIRDDRIRALVLIAPGYSMLFDPASLAEVTVPVLIVDAPGDRLNKPDPQSATLSRYLTKTRTAHALLPEADTLALMAPCPPPLADNLPDLCFSAPPELRRQMENMLVSSLVEFFDRVFPPGKVPAASPFPGGRAVSE